MQVDAAKLAMFWGFRIGGSKKTAKALRESLAADLAMEVERVQASIFSDPSPPLKLI